MKRYAIRHIVAANTAGRSRPLFIRIRIHFSIRDFLFSISAHRVQSTHR
jgi:hypothetical protein